MPGVRKAVKIDEALCDGCGQCVPACEEGAIQIIDGKARLVSEVYCDGLGACLGECPQGAITIQERPAKEFDPEAVERHLARLNSSRVAPENAAGYCSSISGGSQPACCPGSAMRSLSRVETAEMSSAGVSTSELRNWPLQMYLVPMTAPYFANARLLVAADCVPFAYADFHRSLLRGRVVLIGCPKLDETDAYVEKLTAIINANDIQSIEIAHMEVPCCRGMVRLVGEAVAASGKAVPVRRIEIGIQGDVVADEQYCTQR